MKRITLILAFLLALLCLFCACANGSNDGGGEQGGEAPPPAPEHTCVYDQKSEEATFLKNEASCTQRKAYYYSCSECGQTGSETFSVGGYGHTLENGKCTKCDYRESVGLAIGLESAGCWVSGQGTCTDQHIIIPAYYKDLPVTKVSLNGEYYNAETITVPETVTEINSYNSYGFAALYFEGDLGEWLNVRVNGYINALQIYINGSLITDLVIPDGVTKIESGSFQSWSWLESITIPASVTSIEEGAFKGSTNSLKRISVAEGNTVYRSAGNCLLQGVYLLKGCNASVIPDDGSITTIGSYAFENCDGIESLTLPASVTTINPNAFQKCDGLESIVGSNVTYVGGSAFYDCDALSSYAFSENFRADGYAFYECPNLPSSPVEGDVEQVGDFLFRVVENSPVLVGYVGTATELTLPADYQGNPYVIGEKAFYNNNKLYRVVIPDTVTEIGSKAFSKCDYLFNVTLGSGLTAIADDAFAASYRLVEVYNRSSLTVDLSTYGLAQAINIYDYADGSFFHFTEDGYVFYLHLYHTYLLGYIGNDVNLELPAAIPTPSSGLQSNQARLYYTVHDYAFYQCASLVSVKLPARAAFLGKYAFYGCESLTKIDFAGSVLGIGDYALADCSELKTLHLPASIANVGENPFEVGELIALYFDGDLDDWAKINFSSRILSEGNNKKYKVYIDGIKITFYQNVMLSDDVNLIGSYAFADWAWIKELNTGNGVRSIGERAFYNCSDLKMTVIGTKVSVIYDDAFGSCYSLYFVFDLAGLNITKGSTEENGQVGKNATLISRQLPIAKGDFMFVTDTDNLYYLYKYTGTQLDIVLPNDYNGNGYRILRSVFAGLPITSVQIGSGVLEIGYAAFSGCSSLTSVTFGENSQLTSIGEYAFSGCSSLTSITIPASVTSIGEYAFRNCTGLTSITIPASVTTIASSAFDGCNGIIEKENGISYVDKWVIDCDDNISSVTLREDTVGIGPSAFWNCTGLTSITIPSSVTSIGALAFYDCTGLKSVAFDANSRLTAMGHEAFRGCKSLESITLPFVGATLNGASNTHLGYIFGVNSASDNYRDVPVSLKTVVITGGTAIGDLAFYSCSGLTSITIPASVTSIGYRAFADCKNLASVTFGENSRLTTIGNGAFENCSNLTSITIPASVTSVGYGAFQYCTGLTSIMIPASVTSIGDEAFYNCVELASVTFGEDSQLTSIGNRAFENCSNLTSITIPASVTSIASYAFYNCGSLTSVTFEVTEGWRYRVFSPTDTDSTSISATRLEDHSAAALCLTSRSYGYFAGYYWNRG